jgi:hypothetical protein
MNFDLSKYQHVRTPYFYWHPIQKKGIDSVILGEDYNIYRRENVKTWELTDDFTLSDFLNKYNYHYIVFYMYGDSIYHPCNENDDYLKYYSWLSGFNFSSYSRIRAYVEINLKEYRKLKLQNIMKKKFDEY